MNEEISQTMMRMADWQSKHEVSDNIRHEENLKKFDLLGVTLAEIKDNHLRHLQDDSDDMKEGLAELRVNAWWERRLLIGILSGIGVIFIAVIIYALTGQVKLL